MRSRRSNPTSLPPYSSIHHGNTQVTCHMGMPSCGQHHCNVFIDLLLTCTITNTIINDSLASPPCASSPALFSFAHPPTPVLSVTLHLKPNPVEEDQWKGFIHPVHRPSPHGAVNVKSTTPTHPVDYRVNTLNFTCDGTNIHKTTTAIAAPPKSTRTAFIVLHSTRTQNSPAWIYDHEPILPPASLPAGSVDPV